MVSKDSMRGGVKEKPVKIAIGKILDQSLSLVFNQGIWLIGFGILNALPYLIPTLYEYFTNTQDSIPESYSNIVGFLQVFLGVFYTGMLTLVCRDWYMKAKISWKDSFNQAGKYLFRIIGCYILFGLAVGFSSILFVIPGFMVALSFICVLPVLLIEGHEILESFSRSSKLTKGNRWRIFGLFTVSYFIYFVIIGMFLLIKAFFGVELNEEITMSLMTPILIALIAFPQTFLYYDLREKKEGLDLEVLNALTKRLEPVAV